MVRIGVIEDVKCKEFESAEEFKKKRVRLWE